jgi:AAA domain, putative AbiEii toxin, Type IV TA system
MRQVAEAFSWQHLEKQKTANVQLPREVEVGDNKSLILHKRCHILAGFNGAGKSEMLNALAKSLGDQCKAIKLHEVCEQVRSVLLSRSDIEEMEAEVGSRQLPIDLTPTLCSVVGRDYESIEWFDLELEPSDHRFPNWPWLEDLQPIVPHFRVQHEGISYSALQMGLGEFSVHLLFWILLPLRSQPGTVLLLDEPDAYLPPRTRMRLLARLLRLARKHEWQLVITSHSEQLITAAHDNDALYILVRQAGNVAWHRSSDALMRDIVGSPRAEFILFCEDECAAALTRAILAKSAPDIAKKTSVLWNNGDGYLRELAQHLPRTSASPVKFSLIFDGDQRGKLGRLTDSRLDRWPVHTLPTDASPDTLFREAKSQPNALAAALHIDEARVAVALSALAGVDDHDWVNGLCEHFPPRTATLDSLAGLWVDANTKASAVFCGELRAGFHL